MTSSGGVHRYRVVPILTALIIALFVPSLLARSQPALRVHVGEKAPNFTLPSAAGGLVSLSNFAGQNVLLDFYEGYW